MKKSIYLFATILLLSVLTSVNAKAATLTTVTDGGVVGGLLGWLFPPAPTTPTSGTNLPINSNIVFLTIAGVAVGLVVLKKAKTTVAIKG